MTPDQLAAVVAAAGANGARTAEELARAARKDVPDDGEDPTGDTGDTGRADDTVDVRRGRGSFPHPYGRVAAEPAAREPGAREPAAGPTPDESGIPTTPRLRVPGRPVVVARPKDDIPAAEPAESPGFPSWEREEPRPRLAGPRPARVGPVRRWTRAALLRLGDIPVRAVYGVGAALVTALVVVLVFVLFSGDRPEQAPAGSAGGGGPAPSKASRAPAPKPIAVPPVPAAKPMTVFPAPGTSVASYVQDKKARLSYPRYAAPWAKAAQEGFSAAQRTGTSGRQALIGSAPLPVAVPKRPATYEDYRALAGKAVKWSLRHQPAGSKFAWTASQRTPYGLGWMLGYKVTYVVQGKKQSAQAFVMVLANGGKKPGMLFATVPDTRKALYYDLNMLFWTVRPL
ncbi:hypothetical protein [Sphaerisporangium krabiense]|uniref:Uncharacterized protein n=1 Tax=Sphaerisporangium krabiense TaxID=763782 RepID=A0A7W8YZB7_9ACTN|nr:hypothetical protein [Sphaerisporangium krabiense]MBB5624574.1 hypothetical protein [Sphaerisporangium krabiense]